jgi:hypothetical protein
MNRHPRDAANKDPPQDLFAKELDFGEISINVRPKTKLMTMAAPAIK